MAYKIISESCSCCHQCQANCPANAIRVRDRKFWIDPEICLDCGECVKHCHNGVIYSEDHKAAPALPHDKLHFDCELLVAGAGAGGLIAAANFARQTGKKTIIIEKAAEPGGNSWYASGMRAFYSQLHRRVGLADDREARARAILKEMERFGGITEDEAELMRRSLDCGEKIIDWLAADRDADKDLTVGRSPSGNPAMVFRDDYVSEYKRPDTSCGPGGLGSYIVNHFHAICDGLGVEIMTGCQADELILNSEGAVIGLRAHDSGGELEFSCKACILATGSYSRDPELVRRVNPEIFAPGEPLHFYSVPTCTGDGIKIGQKAGLLIDWANMRANGGGPVHHPFGFAINVICWGPEIVYINRDGHRWCAENDRHVDMWSRGKAFMQQPGLMCWGIADKNTAAKIIDDAIASKRDGPAGVRIFRHYMDEIESETKPGGPAFSAETLEELAEKMRVPKDDFIAEIKSYNDMCRAGRDTQFGKDPSSLMPLGQPPYYAFYLGRFQENAMGGIKVDGHTRALREDGSVLPGLYAVGDNACGLFFGDDAKTMTIDKVVPAFTWAATSGYIAGDEAAKYLS